MKKQLVIMGIIALLVCIGLNGCNEINNTINPEKNKFVGTWLNSTKNTYIDGTIYWTNTTYTFLSDGTFAEGLESGTWELKDGKLVIHAQFSDINYIVVNNYSFSDNDKILTLTSVSDGSYTAYTKQ